MKPGVSKAGLKGQSMVEYFTTYGWAIFVLAVILSILLYGGFFRPDFFISEKCEIGSNMPCKAAVYNDGQSDRTKISVEVLNAFSYAVEITSFEVTAADGAAFVFSNENLPKKIESGDRLALGGALPRDKKFDDNALKQLTVRLGYRSCAPELGQNCEGDEHTMTGRIIAKVVPSD